MCSQYSRKHTHAQVMDKVHIGPDSPHTRHVDPGDPSQRFKHETAPDRTYGIGKEYIPSFCHELRRLSCYVIVRRHVTCLMLTQAPRSRLFRFEM